MILDILFALIVAGGLYYGWKRGLVSSVVGALAIVIGLVAAIHFSSVAAQWLESRTGLDGSWTPLVALILVFVLVVLTFRLLSGLMEGMIQTVGLGFANRLAGGLLWATAAALCLSTLLWYADGMNAVPGEAKAGSKTFDTVSGAAPAVMRGVGEVLPAVRDAFADLNAFFAERAREASGQVES